MILKMRLAADLVLGAGLAMGALAMTGAASAQTESASTPTPAVVTPAPTAPPPDLSLTRPADANAGGPTYSVPPPHDSSPGLYLPAVVGGYVKSTAGCVTLGCENGPSVSAPSSPGAEEPPPPSMTPASPGSAPPQ